MLFEEAAMVGRKGRILQKSRNIATSPIFQPGGICRNWNSLITKAKIDQFGVVLCRESTWLVICPNIEAGVEPGRQKGRTE
jgi:hypothetical protein